jgi:hypothetical protein
VDVLPQRFGQRLRRELHGGHVEGIAVFQPRRIRFHDLHGGNSNKEFNQFLNIALGSALETEYLFILSKDLDYLNQEKFQDLELKINNIKSKIYRLKQKLT